MTSNQLTERRPHCDDTGVAKPQTTYQQATRELLRDTLLRAAREQLEQRPWAEITMLDIAGQAGVSRQTLYNEFGNRTEFGQALVLHEGERFLDGVETVVRENFDDPHAAVAAALERFLIAASEDPLIGVLLRDDGTGGLLPFVTTRGLPIVAWAGERIAAVVAEGWPAASGPDVRLLADTLVRLAISHVTTPAGTPHEAAVAASHVLGPFVDGILSPSPE